MRYLILTSIIAGLSSFEQQLKVAKLKKENHDPYPAC